MAGRSTLAIELGPGGVLTGMVRRATPDIRGVSVAVPDDLDKLMDSCGRRRRLGRIGTRQPG